MITISFDRGAGTARYDGITTSGSDAWKEMCRVLTNLRWPDDGAIVVDERGVPCLEIRSIHDTARFYLPTNAEKAARRATILEAMNAEPHR